MNKSLQDGIITSVFIFTLITVVIEFQRKFSEANSPVFPVNTQFIRFSNNKTERAKNSAMFHKHSTKPPNCQCKCFPSMETKFKFGEQLLKMFDGNKEKALEYLYDEMSLNR